MANNMMQKTKLLIIIIAFASSITIDATPHRRFHYQPLFTISDFRGGETTT